MAPTAMPTEPLAASPAEAQPKESSAPSPLPATTSPTASAPSKPIHSLVLDTGPLIKGDPAISTLLAQAEELYTIPAVLEEIRDEQTRSRINSTLLPFLKLRSPKPESIKFITDFARRTGDLEVLSRPDIHLIALTYELEIERNGGDWRLRKEPNQKRVNGSPPKKDIVPDGAQIAEDKVAASETDTPTDSNPTNIESEEPTSTEAISGETVNTASPDGPQEESEDASAPVVGELENLDISSKEVDENDVSDAMPESLEQPVEDEGSDDSDGEWITPSNIKKHQAKANPALAPEPIQRVLQAGMLTSDFAMQNVAIRINLNVVSPTLSRITHLKSWVLRCHGCFTVTRKMDKQFCPSCGQATLTRTSCSTDSAGNFKVHLKRNFQWNNRGNVYSIPKPVHGTANGKMRGSQTGGGKNGWGRELILAEDQKEYTRKADEDRRTRVRDLMDEDYLPGIISGERTGGHGRIRVGAGRNVNGKKRR